MTPVAHPQTTVRLGAPLDWDPALHGECIGLPVVQVGRDYASYWRPSWRERVRLLLGGFVELHVAGRGHPPVSLRVTKRFATVDFEPPAFTTDRGQGEDRKA